MEQRRIEVHPQWISRSEALGGVGCTVCQDTNGHIHKKYDPLEIKRAEEDLQRRLNEDLTFRLWGVAATIGLLYESAKNKLKNYLRRKS